MNVRLSPSSVKGSLTAPASKSAMQRACAAALVRKGKSIIKNPGRSNDDKAALGIITELGADVLERSDGSLQITGTGGSIRPRSGVVDCGESGLSFRMFTPIAALSSQPVTITGSGSLRTRPMRFFDEVLPQLSVHIRSNDGILPLDIRGPLMPGSIEIDGSLSSQFLTGLIFAYAASEAQGSSIFVKGLASKPYVDLSLEVLKQFGLAGPENYDYEEFRFTTQARNEAVISYEVEGDWSGASFLLVAGAIAGEVCLSGLDVFSTQADKAILQALQQTNAFMSIRPDKIEIRSNRLKPFHFNATDCPDLFPPLAALASACDGTSVIEGVRRLKHKESDRGATLQEEFSRLGVEVRIQDDLMIISGSSGLNSSTVNSHHDHRIAMATAIASLRAKGDVTIESAEAINKSYPGFYSDLQSLGAHITINQ